MAFDPEIVKEDEVDIYLRVSRDNYLKRRNRLLKMLLPKQ
jgi:hypothetical protein